MTRSRGFTLLELLIGMTLLGFILALLFGGFRLAAGSWNAIEERAERAADEHAGRALLRRLIATAQPLHLKPPPVPRLAFDGTPQLLRLAAPLTGTQGLRLVELAVESDAPAEGQAALRLVLRHAPLRYEAETFATGLAAEPASALIHGLSDARFSYFGAEKRGDPPQWLESWPNPDQFPLLVRLRLTPRGGAALDVDMAPMAEGDRFAVSRAVFGGQ